MGIRQIYWVALAAAGVLLAPDANASTSSGFYEDPQLKAKVIQQRRIGPFTLQWVAIKNRSDKPVEGPLRIAINTNGKVLTARTKDAQGQFVQTICRRCTVAPKSHSRPRLVVVRSSGKRWRKGAKIRLKAQYRPYVLQLLHNADMDGLGGALENVSPFSAILDALRREYPDNTLVLSSGDNYIPGPRFSAAADDALTALLGVPGQGRADMAFLNAMGYQASAVGNHELDGGPASFAGIINSEANGGFYPGAQFPYLSANLDFEADAATAPLVVAPGQPAWNVPNALTSSVTIEVGGQTFGVVGATTPTLMEITSTGDIGVRPDAGAPVAALAAEIQPAIDALVAAGIDKIILLAHMQQIQVEKDLAGLLKDVDVIIAGGSNTLLADSTDQLLPGDVAADTYPLSIDNANGGQTLVVNTAGDYRYLGRLVAAFDLAGRIIPASLHEAVNGAYAVQPSVLDALGNPLPVAQVADIATAISEVLAQLEGNVLGRTSQYLDGRRSQVRSQETNLGNLTADANLWFARQQDASVLVSLKNGGGIRSEIGFTAFPAGSTNPDDLQFFPPAPVPASGKQSGDISQADIQTALRFDNGLTLLNVTAAQLQALMEHSVSDDNVGDPLLVTPGKFPQVAGMRFSFDNSQPAGSRVRSLAIVDATGAVIDPVVANGVLQGDANRQIRMVTLDFLASGGDGYPFPDLAASATNAVALKAADTDPMTGSATFAPDGGEQDVLAEYLQLFFSSGPFNEMEQPNTEDNRIQNLGVRTDTVLN